MPTLSSRPDLEQDYSDEELLAVIKPVINLLDWLAAKTALPDNSTASLREGQHVIEEIISCFEFDDFTVVPGVAPLGFFLYDVAIKPYSSPFDRYVTFRITLRVKP
jgi:hypothetical protein